MTRTAQQLVKRFPEQRKAIATARRHDALFDELCLDYEAVTVAISAVETRKELAERFDSLHRELIDLSEKLEKEVLDRLSAEPKRQEE